MKRFNATFLNQLLFQTFFYSFATDVVASFLIFDLIYIDIRFERLKNTIVESKG